MPIIVQGNAGTAAEVDGTTFRAFRTTPRPTEYTSFGHYKYGGFTGIIPAALAANSEIFQFRWSDATRIGLIQKIRISACVTTTFFAAGVPVQLDVVKAAGWSAVGTGGTRPAFAATGKMRTSMGSSLLGANDVGIATTAALGAGTKTLEANSLSAIVAPGPITASLNGQIIPPGTVLWEPDIGDGEHPLALVQNEGFVIRSVAVPATGTWQAAFHVTWAEVAVF